MSKLIKKIIMLSLIPYLSGCEALEKIVNPDHFEQDQYNYMKNSLMENTAFKSSNSYYDLDITVAQVDGNYQYTVTLYNPSKALINVGIMVMDSLGYQGNEDHIETVGVLDGQYSLIPGQVYNAEGLVDSLTVSGTINAMPDSLKILVTWNDDDFSNYTSDYYYIDVQDVLTLTY